MNLAVAGLALFVGLLISATLHFVVLWPRQEPAPPPDGLMPTGSLADGDGPASSSATGASADES